MRVLFWYCEQFDWTPAMQTLADAPPAQAAANVHCVVAFLQVEPADVEPGSAAETKLVKNAKLHRIRARIPRRLFMCSGNSDSSPQRIDNMYALKCCWRTQCCQCREEAREYRSQRHRAAQKYLPPAGPCARKRAAAYGQAQGATVADATGSPGVTPRCAGGPSGLHCR